MSWSCRDSCSRVAGSERSSLVMSSSACATRSRSEPSSALLATINSTGNTRMSARRNIRTPSPELCVALPCSVEGTDRCARGETGRTWELWGKTEAVTRDSAKRKAGIRIRTPCDCLPTRIHYPFSSSRDSRESTTRTVACDPKEHSQPPGHPVLGPREKTSAGGQDCRSASQTKQ